MVVEKNSLLAPYVVLDLTNEWGLLCGRLMADLGADVIKVEQPGGDPARNIGPFYKDIPHPEKSLHWFFHNANKRGITLNLETADGKEIFKNLVKKADFVLESFQPGHMEKLGLGYGTLSEINPKIILTSITPFGQEGPYSQFKGSDITTLALSGWMYKCGDDDRAPVQMGIPQSNYHGSAQAAAASLMALYYREMNGEGQHVDAYSMPWITFFSQAPMRWYITKNNEGRHGPLWEWSGRPLVRYVWECKDGAVCFAVTGGARFGQSQIAIVKWMDEEGVAPEYLKTVDWNNLDWGTVTKEARDSFEQPVVQFLKQKTKAEIFREAVKRGILLFPANTAKEILEEPQLKFRNYWVNVEHPELGTSVTYPGAFYNSNETAWKMKRRAPLIGEHNDEIYTGMLGFTREHMILLKENNVI